MVRKICRKFVGQKILLLLIIIFYHSEVFLIDIHTMVIEQERKCTYAIMFHALARYEGRARFIREMYGIGKFMPELFAIIKSEIDQQVEPNAGRSPLFWQNLANETARRFSTLPVLDIATPNFHREFFGDVPCCAEQNCFSDFH